MTPFVDTSFYSARIMPRDQWHEKALFTSRFVINETISLLEALGGTCSPAGDLLARTP